MDEFQFINKIKQKDYKQSSLIKGIGDDAAVFRERTNDLVVAKDTFVDGVHFSEKTMSFFHVGYRVMAVNVSDLAAMGAMPLYYLVSIVIPKRYNEKDILEIYDGMSSFASLYQIDLIGGDTVAGNELVISVTVIGSVSDKHVPYRHNARVDDLVFVTGTLGNAAAGLHVLLNDEDVKHKGFFIKKHRMPEPRVDFARSLHGIKRLSLNDVSDGVASEAYEIAEASGKSLVLNNRQIPVHRFLTEFTYEQQNEWKLFGGEDFELIGTVAVDEWYHVKQAARESNIAVCKIGYVKELTDYFVYIEDENGLKPLNKRGYIHLK